MRRETNYLKERNNFGFLGIHGAGYGSRFKNKLDLRLWLD
jgi:hypothetical protein